MTTDINKRLIQLRARRTGMSTGMEAFAKAGSVFDSITEDAAGPESWEIRGTATQQWTKYTIGAMEAVGKTYTKVSLATADRVADQLRGRLAAAGIKVEFKLQGSVPLDVHIKRVSDVDLLTIRTDFLTYSSNGVKARLGKYGNSSDTSSERVLATLRTQVELDLPEAFPAADVDKSGPRL